MPLSYYYSVWFLVDVVVVLDRWNQLESGVYQERNRGYLTEFPFAYANNPIKIAKLKCVHVQQ